MDRRWWNQLYHNSRFSINLYISCKYCSIVLRFLKHHNKIKHLDIWHEWLVWIKDNRVAFIVHCRANERMNAYAPCNGLLTMCVPIVMSKLFFPALLMSYCVYLYKRPKWHNVRVAILLSIHWSVLKSINTLCCY